METMYCHPEQCSSILTWLRGNHDHKGGSPKVRPYHCTTAGLTLAINPNVVNSGVQFLVVGDCVRAVPSFNTIKINNSVIVSTGVWSPLEHVIMNGVAGKSISNRASVVMGLSIQHLEPNTQLRWKVIRVSCVVPRFQKAALRRLSLFCFSL